MKAIFIVPHLLMLIPVWVLQWQFENPDVGLFFGLVLTFITVKLFPWVMSKEDFEKHFGKRTNSNDSNDSGN